MRILCVCLGNICRSPMAEGVLREKAAQAGLSVEVDSAGTGAWHVGNPPDRRGLLVAQSRGYDNTHQRARKVAPNDFSTFDIILAMDASNLSDLHTMAPASTSAQIRMMRPDGQDIPDPYYGGPEGFDTVLDMLEEAADALIEGLTARDA